MKKLLVYLYLIFISQIILNFPIKTSYADTTYFAKIEQSSVFIFSTPVQDDSSKIFELPITYFVELIKSENEEFYYCRYNDIYGYVLKSQVKPIKNIPQNPFLTNISFRVFVPSGANLRESPYNNGAQNLIYSIPFLDSNISYYGVAYGEEEISKKGNVWYYCKYLSQNQSYIGYIYSPLCDCLSPITQNTETVEYLPTPPTFEEDSTKTSTSNVFSTMSSTTTTIIIIAVSLPCLLFIYLLFKPTKIAEESVSTTSNTTKTRKPRTKKKIKRLKHSDYFELDDDY